jgi:hypothetical protein
MGKAVQQVTTTIYTMMQKYSAYTGTENKPPNPDFYQRGGWLSVCPSPLQVSRRRERYRYMIQIPDTVTKNSKIRRGSSEKMDNFSDTES